MHDLIVIGGGPGGASCARRAALNGLDVVLVEKHHHPRPKPCGGALGPQTLNILDFDYSHLIQREFQGAKVYLPSGKSSVLTQDDMKGHTIHRNDFDSLLIDKAREAGAEIVLDNEIVAIEQLRKGVRALGVGDSYKAHLLVGADGVNGVSMKELDIRHRWSVEDVAVCITAEVPVDPSEIERTMTLDAESSQFLLELYYGDVEWGYGWCFPKSESLNIGLGCRLDKAKGLRDKWEPFLSKISSEKDIKIKATESTSARVPLGGTSSRIIGRRSMLVGDAAGLVSPVSGEGISFAIESGILAADVATEAVRKKSAVHIVEYDRRMKNTLLEELKDLHSLAGIMYKSNSNLEMLFDIIDDDTIMKGYLSDIFTRITPYSKIKYKLAKRLLTKHPRKAIKLGF
ncbi:MAG: geranylgeranyl reductase family protein [Candidatus Thorarchaeota archaeon]|nr:MAG: geranylgeranyl reductase family protein [Candidatus Thorarchaeota archaeon]